MTLTEVVNAHLKTFNTSWDYTIDDSHTVDDISIDKVLAFAERIKTTHDSMTFENPLTLLRKFELLREGGITRAGFLLFTADETSFTTIELGRFQTPTLIKDGARLKTDLISEVEAVMAFVKKHINKAYVITRRPEGKSAGIIPWKLCVKSSSMPLSIATTQAPLTRSSRSSMTGLRCSTQDYCRRV